MSRSPFAHIFGIPFRALVGAIWGPCVEDWGVLWDQDRVCVSARVREKAGVRRLRISLQHHGNLRVFTFRIGGGEAGKLAEAWRQIARAPWIEPEKSRWRRLSRWETAPWQPLDLPQETGRWRMAAARLRKGDGAIYTVLEDREESERTLLFVPQCVAHALADEITRLAHA